MEAFRRLGSRLSERWREVNHDQSRFADLATLTLQEFFPTGLRLQDVLEWVQTTSDWVPQVESTFGNPLTVYREQRFFIDVLTWIDGTTSIHEHAFDGAFGVLEGFSLHSKYSFAPTQPLSERLILGTTTVRAVELLTGGDVRPIYSGPRSAHALFHLARPSVSVVVRTGGQRPGVGAGISSQIRPIQYEYYRCGLAFDPFYEDYEAIRIARSLRIMFEIGHPQFEQRVKTVLTNRDAWTRFLTFRWLSALMPLKVFLDLLATLDDGNSGFNLMMREMAIGFKKHAAIAGGRKLVKNEEHRFFLGLLLNLPNSKEILPMIRARWPAEDPASCVQRWAFELGLGQSKSEVVGPHPIDETLSEVMETLTSSIWQIGLANGPIHSSVTRIG